MGQKGNVGKGKRKYLSQRKQLGKTKSKKKAEDTKKGSGKTRGCLERKNPIAGELERENNKGEATTQ